MVAFSRLALLLWSTAALAMPTTEEEIDPVTGLLKPHFYDEIDLDEYEAWVASGKNWTDSLIKRTQVKVCSYTTFQGSCHSILDPALSTVSYDIAARFVKSAKEKPANCDHFTGGGFDFNWDLHATNKDPSNNECGTKAQRGTINGALQNYFVKTDFNTCGVKCLQLSHGGTWRGYVSFAINGYTASNYGCGPHSANVCYSGGEKDCYSGYPC